MGNQSILHLFPALRVGGWRSLCELTYYHHWLNISAELLNNKVLDWGTVLDIPDGYYNICELDKEAFRTLGAEHSLRDPTGRLQLSAKKRLGLNGGLAKLLGFSKDIWARREPHCRRATSSGHPLGDLRASCQGQYVGEHAQQSLLKSIPIENERCGGGRTEAFPVLQYKRLASGLPSQLTLTILDTSGRYIDFDYLSAVLHIRRNG